MKIEIIHASSKDFEDVYDLLCHLWAKPRINKKKLIPIYISQIKYGKKFLFAKVDDKYVGMISLNTKLDIESHGKVGLIEELVVIDSYRNKKIGEKLIYSVIKEAKKEKCIEVQLYSRIKNIKAHKFYKRFGFNKAAYLFWRNI
ncbi:GNAT family N-acetyltransferase [Candidatus Pacearchaeota archaeon]|nr:GNAT family N-acetyltransferase [Candidatus Pacearchaeota archaeon]